MGLPIAIRGAFPDELRLIYKSWIKTQKGSRVAKLMPRTVHDTGLHRIIERLIATADILIAEFEEEAIGFVVATPGVIHYLFVKEPYRRKAVARRLVDALGTSPIVTREGWRYSHKPEEWRGITIPSSWVYDPFAAWCPEES